MLYRIWYTICAIPYVLYTSIYNGQYNWSHSHSINGTLYPNAPGPRSMRCRHRRRARLVAPGTCGHWGGCGCQQGPLAAVSLLQLAVFCWLAGVFIVARGAVRWWRWEVFVLRLLHGGCVADRKAWKGKPGALWVIWVRFRSTHVVCSVCLLKAKVPFVCNLNANGECEEWMRLGDQFSFSSTRHVLLCGSSVYDYEGISCPIKHSHLDQSLHALIHFVIIAVCIRTQT